MKFYVASSFRNIDIVRSISEKLKQKGCSQTYDWTENEGVFTIEQLKEIGKLEMQAVLEADVMIMVYPGGKGSHVELGIALGSDKKVYIYSASEELNNLADTTTFYHLEGINKFIGTVEDFLDYLLENESVYHLNI